VHEDDETEAPRDLSPDPARVDELRRLVDRYGLVTASRLAPHTEAERHLVATGHRLAHGCCRGR
jgi:hypothetical protein